MKQGVKEFKLSSEFIELDNLLKIAGFAGSAGAAGNLIKEGLVKVNGSPEARVRRKLKAGDCVEFKGVRILIA